MLARRYGKNPTLDALASTLLVLKLERFYGHFLKTVLLLIRGAKLNRLNGTAIEWHFQAQCWE